MQSFIDANLRCCECQEKFSSASALLQHLARHALAERDKQGNKFGEGNFRYDWQPWRCDDIFKTKRKGHNFLETALLSINESCRKRAKLQTSTTPVSTSSENSSHSLTEKSDTSETETKGAEHSQDGIGQENHQSLTSNFESSSKNPSKFTNKSKGTSISCDEESVENIEGLDRCISNVVQSIKLEEKTTTNSCHECIVKNPGPERILTPTSSTTNPVLPLELRTSETCCNRTNDDCDVVYDNDDNSINLENSLGKVNCDNNNVIYYNGKSRDKLPNILESGKNLDKNEGSSKLVVADCSVEERKRKLSNRKQTTPKKIERNGSGFLKIAPRPENSPREERQISNKKGTKKKYCCPLCSRVFGWSTDLKRHILVHTGERPFKCSSCSSSFTRKFLLQKHQNKMHPLNGKTERERLLDLKVSENLKQLKSKMLELQNAKLSGSKTGQHKEAEIEHFEQNDSDKGHEEIIEEIYIKEETPYETFFKGEKGSDETWDSTSNNNNNNNVGEIEFSKACKNENLVYVEPIIIQSS